MSLTDTHLNITSVVGPMSMELLPPPGSENRGNGLFQRLRASTLSAGDTGGSSGVNPVAAAKRAAPLYPFCELRPHGFSLMEYATLSFLPYLEKDSASFHTFFDAVINGNGLDAT